MLGQHESARCRSTRTVVYLFYQDAFIDNERGYAAAIAFVLLLSSSR